MPVGKFWDFLSDDSGATAIEYALLATLCAVAIAGTFALLGDQLQALFNSGAGNTLDAQTEIMTGG
jgi:pilus assembly protein Flp/PilA